MKPLVVGIAAVGVAVIALLAAFIFPHVVPVSNPDALQFSASLDFTVLTQNQTVFVNFSDRNPLWQVNSLPFAQEWRVANASTGVCDQLSPFGVAVYEGRHDLSNISSARQLEIEAPGLYSCPPAWAGGAWKVAPMHALSRQYGLLGYWTPGWTQLPGGGVTEGVFHHFQPGTYTLYAGDEWGHYRMLYFTVTAAA